MTLPEESALTPDEELRIRHNAAMEAYGYPPKPRAARPWSSRCPAYRYPTSGRMRPPRPLPKIGW
jgi:hypothetical protein